MRKNIFPILLISGGCIILIAAIGLLLHTQRDSAPFKELLPPILGGLPLSEAVYGEEALAGVTQLHGVEFPMSDAAIGVYGNQGELTLWISVEPDEATALELTDVMTEKINEGRSPFTLPERVELGDGAVYTLEGLGQQHYYWQAGELVIWLSVDFDLAGAALAESLAYYR